MFGGLGKFILLGLIVGAVWFGFKLFQRRAAMLDPGRDAAAKDAKGASKGGVEDMRQCAVCHTYYASAEPESCGRHDCPYTA